MRGGGRLSTTATPRASQLWRGQREAGLRNRCAEALLPNSNLVPRTAPPWRPRAPVGPAHPPSTGPRPVPYDEQPVKPTPVDIGAVPLFVLFAFLQERF